MFRNYIKIAFRNLFMSKVFSFINILGLSLGIASSIVIYLFVNYDLTYDAYNKNAKDIYLVQKYRTTGLGLKILNDTWIPLMSEMKDTYPAVTDGTRIYNSDSWIKFGKKKFRETITFADQSIFNVFTMPLALGDKNTVFNDRFSIVITKEIAHKYFGDENPIGETLTVNFDTDYKITGVLEDLPRNISFSPTILANIDADLDPANAELQNNWDGAFLFTFLKLDKNTTPTSLEAQLPNFVNKIWGENGPNGSKQLQLKLLPLLDYHNSEFNTRIFSYILICIAFGIILLAAINFMNLSTAKSMERIHEIGMRKVFGAQKRKIVFQFLSESFLVSLIALIIGLGISALLLPQVNKLYDLNLSLSIFNNIKTPFILVCIWIITGLASGSYPALRISRYKVIESMKGQVKNTSSGLIFRNALIAFQFIITIILIAGTLIALNQTNYMKDHNVNFEKENVMVLPVSLRDFADRETAASKLDAIKNELRKYPAITNVSASMSVPGEIVNANVFATPENWQSPDPLRMQITTIDQNFLDVYKLELIEGRNFSEEFGTDQESSIIVNETAMHGMGWNTAVGKKVKIGSTFYNVVGVVKDYNTESLENQVRPLIHLFRTTESGSLGFMSIKIQTEELSNTINFVKSEWAKLDPNRNFEYFFVDENFATLYRNQDRTVAIVSYFSVLAIIIACLGLFGLLLITITQKTKEIGIRKILGSNISSLLFLLSKKFILLVAFANLIALPLVYYLMQKWLEDFAYRIDINIWTLIISGCIIMLFTIVTVGFLSFRAANMNPVEALRYE